MDISVIEELIAQKSNVETYRIEIENMTKQLGEINKRISFSLDRFDREDLNRQKKELEESISDFRKIYREEREKVEEKIEQYKNDVKKEVEEQEKNVLSLEEYEKLQNEKVEKQKELNETNQRIGELNRQIISGMEYEEDILDLAEMRDSIVALKNFLEEQINTIDDKISSALIKEKNIDILGENQYKIMRLHNLNYDSIEEWMNTEVELENSNNHETLMNQTQQEQQEQPQTGEFSPVGMWYVKQIETSDDLSKISDIKVLLAEDRIISDDEAQKVFKIAQARINSLSSVKTEPAKTGPVKTELAKKEPVKTEPAKTGPVKTEPAKKEPVKTEPAKTEPAKKEPAKPKSSDWDKYEEIEDDSLLQEKPDRDAFLAEIMATTDKEKLFELQEVLGKYFTGDKELLNAWEVQVFQHVYTIKNDVKTDDDKKITNITINPKTGMLGYKYINSEGKIVDGDEIELKYDEQFSNNPKISNLLSYCKKEVKDFREKLDPNIIMLLSKMNNKQLYEYIKAVGGKEEKMPFQLDYDLEDIKNNNLSLKERRKIKTIANAVKGLKNVNVTKSKNIFEKASDWIKNKFGNMKQIIWPTIDKPKSLPKMGEKKFETLKKQIEEKCGKYDVSEKLEFENNGRKGMISKGKNGNVSMVYEYENSSGIARLSKGITTTTDGKIWNNYTCVDNDGNMFECHSSSNGEIKYIQQKEKTPEGEATTIISNLGRKLIKSVQVDEHGKHSMLNFNYESVENEKPDSIEKTFYMDGDRRTTNAKWKYDFNTGKYFNSITREVMSLEKIECGFARENHGIKITGSNADRIFMGEKSAVEPEMEEAIKYINQGELRRSIKCKVPGTVLTQKATEGVIPDKERENE